MTSLEELSRHLAFAIDPKSKVIGDIILAVLIQVRDAERERCAGIADEWASIEGIDQYVAAQIRKGEG